MRKTDDETIIKMLGEGKTQKQVAEHFGVSPAAICKRVKRILPEPKSFENLTAKEQRFALEVAKIHWRRPYVGTVSLQGLPQCRGAQFRRDKILRDHDAQVTVGEIVEGLAVTGQIVRWTPYGQYQAQHLLEIQ